MPAKLSDNHRRRLSVTAKTVEETIDQIELVLDSSQTPQSMRRVKSGYTLSERKRLRAILQELREANERMIQELGLQKQKIDERQIIWAAITRLWLILSDSLAAKMKGFGEMKGPVAKTVDGHVEQMLKILDKISEDREM